MRRLTVMLTCGGLTFPSIRDEGCDVFLTQWSGLRDVGSSAVLKAVGRFPDETHTQRLCYCVWTTSSVWTYTHTTRMSTLTTAAALAAVATCTKLKYQEQNQAGKCSCLTVGISSCQDVWNSPSVSPTGVFLSVETGNDLIKELVVMTQAKGVIMLLNLRGWIL